jgi:hypothetical protein
MTIDGNREALEATVRQLDFTASVPDGPRWKGERGVGAIAAVQFATTDLQTGGA